MLLYGKLRPLWAMERLHEAQAVSQAIALAFASKNDSRAREGYDLWTREAYPVEETGRGQP